MNSKGLLPIGIFEPTDSSPLFFGKDLITHISSIRQSVHVIKKGINGPIGTALSGNIYPPQGNIKDSTYLLMGTLPPLYPEWLGDRSFLQSHKVRFPYIAGAMYHNITTTKIVIAMAKSGMMGFYGSAGLSPTAIEKAINEIQGAIGSSNLSWGSNLIHTPAEPGMEEEVVDLYLKKGVRRISASAFMSLTPSIVRYSANGLQMDTSGNIHRKNYVFAKISRPEIASLFMSPAPKKILDLLVSQNKISKSESELAAKIPIAEDITVEADSGGHTDNRPLISLLPTILMLRDELAAQYGYTKPLRVGAAGGISTPSSVAAAFALGAAYVLTGTINQSTIEAGVSAKAKEMLALANIANIAMAPAGDMFELGVKVQVLKRGTLFSSRASQLYQIYSNYDSIESIPPAIKSKLEKNLFRAPLQDIWKDTRNYFLKRSPKEVTKAEKNPKHLMALVFRWYLGNAGNWAIDGEPSRIMDYQIQCGPSMGAFNAWTAGSFLAKPENRKVVTIALNLLEGAAVVTRAQQFRSYGVAVPELAFNFRPKTIY